MCFKSKYKTIYTAQEDIICYKDLCKSKGKYVSPCYFYEYKKNQPNPVIKLSPTEVCCCKGYYYVDEGYHAYANKFYRDINIFNSEPIFKNTWTPQISDKLRLSYRTKLCTECKFVIPKGTRYMTNGTEIVAETMTFIGEIPGISDKYIEQYNYLTSEGLI